MHAEAVAELLRGLPVQDPEGAHLSPEGDAVQRERHVSEKGDDFRQVKNPCDVGLEQSLFHAPLPDVFADYPRILRILFPERPPVCFERGKYLRRIDAPVASTTILRVNVSVDRG